jgi:hypothetical protein
MANPTTNYGWQMPTSSDLVTDLPADFEVFGQAVDTALADLKGGTSGQVLAKNSNTDMDFVWVAQDDSNAIQNAIVDAKGDLIAASAADTPARLAVGNNGETIVADSSTATGLRYQPTMAAGKNAIINGAFDIWQRGTSIAVNAAAYTTDRWLGYRGVAGMTVSRQSTNDTTNLPFIQYCARVQRDSGNTSTSSLQFTSSVETSNVYRYTGQTITMSFYARAGANYSPTSSALGVFLSTGTGTDGNPLTGYTGQTNTISQTATLTTTWQRFSYTATLTSTTTQMAPYFVASVTGTAGANDWFEVTGVQVELGSVATAFSRTGGTIQGELAACQRYYYRIGGSYVYEILGVGNARSTTVGDVVLTMPVSMRTAPSSIDFSSIALLRDFGSSPIAITSVAFSGAGKNTAISGCTVASGLTAGQNYYTVANNSTSAYLAVSAEL